MKSLAIFLCVIFCNTSYIINSLTFGGHKLTLEEAERILGESCLLEEDTSLTTNGGHKYKSTYRAHSSNKKSDNKVALYFSFESYKDETSAKEIFNTFKVSNQAHNGFEMLSLGDESFFQTDSKNFCVIIVRKENEMVLLKVNKLTSKTSVAELKKIAANVIERV
ncbi:MAG: hypothetical protein JJE09_11585 [Bacteroidia bacterium]|nr:hypothetical protein [Bacteroidia bacterium]